jgi:glycosyltransferase involved in cell wall biosynthesis
MTRPFAANEPSGRPGPPSVSVVVPALNEERNLPYVFGRLPRDVAEVILVDGGSEDRTVEAARRLLPSVIVVQQTRTGKGNALACGFAASTGDIVVMIDADGSTDPAEIPRFVDALVRGADFAKGSRFRPGGDSHDITRLRRLGNHGLNGVVNVLFRTHFTDLCYGYNAFWRRVLPFLDLPDPDLPMPADGSKLWGDGFEIETLINIRVAAHRLKIEEVPSVEARRLHGVSNLNAFSDGGRVLRTIFTEYRRLRGRAVRKSGRVGAGRPAITRMVESPGAPPPTVDLLHPPTTTVGRLHPPTVAARHAGPAARPESAAFAREER